MSTRRYSDMKSSDNAVNSENQSTPGTKAIPHKKSRISDSPVSSRVAPRTPLTDVSLNLSKVFDMSTTNDLLLSNRSSILQSPSLLANAMNNTTYFKPIFDVSSSDDSPTEVNLPGRSLFDEINEQNPESSILGSATPLYDTLNFDDYADTASSFVQDNTLNFSMGLSKTPESGEPEDINVTLEADEVQVEVDGEVVIAEMSMLKVVDGSGDRDQVSPTIEVQHDVGDIDHVETEVNKAFKTTEPIKAVLEAEINPLISQAVEAIENTSTVEAKPFKFAPIEFESVQSLIKDATLSLEAVEELETTETVITTTEPSSVNEVNPVKSTEFVADDNVESMNITETSLIFSSEDNPVIPTFDAFVASKMSPITVEASAALTPQSSHNPDITAVSPDLSLNVSGLSFNMNVSDRSFFSSPLSKSSNDNGIAHKTFSFNNDDESGSATEICSSPTVANDSIVSFLGHEIKVHANLDDSVALRSVAELQQKSVNEVTKLRILNKDLLKQLTKRDEIENCLKHDLERERLNSEDYKLMYEELASKMSKQQHHMKPILDEALAEQLEELTSKLSSESHMKEEYRREMMKLRGIVAELTTTLQTFDQNPEKISELKTVKEELATVNKRLESTLETNREFDEMIRKLHDNEVNLNDIIDELKKDAESNKKISDELKKYNDKMTELGIDNISQIFAQLESQKKEIAEKNTHIDDMYTEIHVLKLSQQRALDSLNLMKEELAQLKVAAANVQPVELAPVVDTSALDAAVAENTALKVQLASVQEELTPLIATRDTLAAEVKTFKTRCLELVNAEVSLNNENFDEKAKFMEEIYSRIQVKLTNIDQHNATQNFTINDFNQKLNAQTHELETLRATVSHFEHAFKEQDEEVASNNAENFAMIDKLKEELDVAICSVNILSAENAKLVNVVQESNNKLVTLEEACRSAETFGSNVNSLLTEKLKDLATSEARLKDLEAQIAKAETDVQRNLDEVQKELADLRESANTSKALVVEKDATIADLHAKLTKVSAEAEATKNVSICAFEKIQDDLKEATERLSKIQLIETRLEELTVEVAQKNAELIDVKCQLKKANLKSLSEETRLSELSAELKQKNGQIEELQVKLDNSRLSLHANQDRISELVSAVEQKNLLVAVIQSDLETVRTDYGQLESDVKSLRETVKFLTEKLSIAEDQIAAAATCEASVEELKFKLSKVESHHAAAIEEHSNEVASLQTSIDSLKTSLAAAQADAASSVVLKERVTELKSELAKLKNFESAAKAQIFEQKAIIDGFKIVSTDLDQRIDNLTNQKIELEIGRREALSQKIKAEQQLAQLRIDLEEQYQVKETELNNVASTLKAELESKTTRITDLQREITELRDQILELETRELEQTISIPPMAPVSDKIREAVAAIFNPVRTEMQAKIDKLVDEQAELQTKIAIMQSKYARGKVVYQQVRNERNTLREQLQQKAAVAEASTITDEVTTLSNAPIVNPAVEKLQARINSYKEQIGKLNDELDNTDDNMNVLRQEIYRRTVQMNELKRRLGDTDFEVVSSMEDI